MRAFVTGVGGFVGRHLVRHLVESGDSVSGLGRESECADIPGLSMVYSADLRDTQSVGRAVDDAQPEAIYHLAAQSSTGDSLTDPWATLSNNLQAQMVLFETLLRSGVSPRVLVVGSSDEYGRIRPDELPTGEDVPLRPASPYAVSKVGQDMLGYQYFAQNSLPVVRVRPFSHTGPGHDARFVIPSFARQLAECEAGLRPAELRVGNLAIERDFTDVRDVVRAYRLALAEGEPGEVYNVGSGRCIRLDETLLQLVEMCRVKPIITVDATLLRPIDVPRQQADITRFQARTGWVPNISWNTTLSDTLNYWRKQVANEGAR